MAYPSAYDNAVLADSPHAYWPLDETSGTSLVDHVSSLNLALQGSTPTNWTLNQTGIGDGSGAVLFAGTTTSYASKQTPADTVPSGASYTVELWINPTNIGATPDSTAGTFFTTRVNVEFGFDAKTAGSASIKADIGNGTSWLSTAANLSGTGILATGVWAHVAYVVTATTYTGYVNGVSRGSGSWASNTPLLWNASRGIQVGGYSSGPEWFAGNIAKVAVYNAALSQSQLQGHINAAVAAASIPDLIMAPPHR